MSINAPEAKSSRKGTIFVCELNISHVKNICEEWASVTLVGDQNKVISNSYISVVDSTIHFLCDMQITSNDLTMNNKIDDNIKIEEGIKKKLSAKTSIAQNNINYK